MRTCDETLDALRVARAAGDLSRLSQELHSLKGALAVFGYRDIVAECDAIERMIETQGYAAVSGALDALLHNPGWLDRGGQSNLRV
ncbi:Hpt domain-containing protein [Paraburkholderia fungorum]|uniref:Hpt domain-containing protein n=1 Tax=Paraburkholderia fungorum TaxID=134537 RepID=UPI00094283B2